jgi:succinate-semialdehyde dehydrogenase/glutarate-semialdehyde dehydrogenase
VLHEEPFGPLALMLPFDSADEVYARANALPFALAAYAFSRSASECARAARTLEAGVVAVNHTAVGLSETPFGGLKDSGHGSEGGSEGLDAYLVTRLVSEAA